MPKIAQFVCAVCGAVKGEANHWWIVLQQNYDFTVFPFGDGLDMKQPTAECYCGQSCVTKALSEYLGRKEQAK